jgi:hypothetical protein
MTEEESSDANHDRGGTTACVQTDSPSVDLPSHLHPLRVLHPSPHHHRHLDCHLRRVRSTQGARSARRPYSPRRHHRRYSLSLSQTRMSPVSTPKRARRMMLGARVFGRAACGACWGRRHRTRPLRPLRGGEPLWSARVDRRDACAGGSSLGRGRSTAEHILASLQARSLDENR